MSPEQAIGETALDGRSDLYSLAIVGFEMLTGRPPFIGVSPMSVVTKHLTEPPPNARTLRPDVPGSLAGALDKALAKNPADRFQTASAFRAALGTRYTATAPSRRRPRWQLAALGVAVVVAVAAVVLTRRGGTGDTARVDQNLVAIAPFDVFDSAHVMWREGLVDVLAANLDGAGPLRSVSPALAVKRWRGAAAERGSALEFARGLNAGLVIFGRVISAGRDSVRITASLLDATSNRPIGEVEVRDDISRMDRIADSLSLRILAELGESRAIGIVRRGTIGSTSVPAIKAYLQGAQFYRRIDWDSATFYFQRAVEIDSNFAPALRLLSNSMSWQTTGLGAFRADYRPYVLSAGAKNVGLAPRESVLVASDSIFSGLMIRLQSGPPAGDAYALAERLFKLLEGGSQRFPEDPEMWFKRGDARFHFGFLHPSTQTLTQVRAAFDRAIALDSAFAPSYIHLVQVLNQLQDVDAMRAAMAAFLALEPGGEQAAGLRLATKLLDPATPRDEQSLGTLFSSTDMRAIGTAYVTLLFVNDTAETQAMIARSMVRGLKEGRIPEAAVNQVREGAAQGLVARGHIREALEFAPNTPALLVQAGFVGMVPADSVDRVIAGSRAQLNDDTVGPAILWYTFRGDTIDMASLVERMRRAKSGFLPGQLPAGALALARRDTAAAIRHLTMPDSVCLTWCSFARLLLARLLAAKGDDVAAARVYDQDYTTIGLGKIMWMLDRGRVNQRLGNRQKAIDSYAFVTTAWPNADPGLNAYVEEARRGLSELRSDPGRR